jgi:hypothetical protein
MAAMKILAVALLAPFAVALIKPPAAHITTSSGRHQLGFSTYCWTAKTQSLCVDYAAPHCKGPAAGPVIRVHRGERVRFDLGFTPRSVSISVANGRSVDLAATRHPTWRANRAGPLWLFVDAKTNGDASYVACIVFR